mmetsp:Transcript_15519/g.50867  ORF Transcript_15519/g.50867 Transcript_15519/m.50867 type:complete len:141 (-) Transcript_15519:259-681(-)
MKVLCLLLPALAAGFLATPAQRRGGAVYAEKKEEEKPFITAQSLMELVTMGLGAPNLGKFKGVDEKTGSLKFELEANKIVDKNGKEYPSWSVSNNPYLDDCYVDENRDPMGYFMKMIGLKKDDDDDNKKSGDKLGDKEKK